MPLLLMGALLGACGELGEGEEAGAEAACELQPAAGGDTGPVHLRYELGGEYFGRPFPDDSRLRADGTLDLAGFPNPTDSDILDYYLETISQTQGWGTNAGIFITFSGPVDPGSLPDTDQALGASLAPDATVYLVDVDPSSPDQGERIPVKLRWQPEATLYLPANTLAMHPVLGFPLRDANRYAAVVTTGVRDLSCRPLVMASGEQAERLREAGVAVEGLAGGAVFTTQDVVGPMNRLRDAVHELPEPRIQGLSHRNRYPNFDIYEGSLQIPSYQRGELPYWDRGSGGDVEWAGDGSPVLQGWQEAKLVLTIPRTAGGTPRQGWPLVIYSHGTGGDAESFVDNDTAEELARRGLAVVGFDQVMHGSRVPDFAESSPELFFFNLNNIVAARDNVRQGGVDGFVMARLARSGIEIPRHMTPDNRVTSTDPARIVFLGHSQGGLTGAPAVAAEPDLLGAVFSGTSGNLGVTLMERKDPVDFMLLAQQFFNLRDREELDLFHPIVSLMQTFIEPADPINYAPHFVLDTGEKWPTPVLILEGFHDHASPATGIEAFAVAAGAHLVEPVGRSVPALEVAGREVLEAPVSGNVKQVTVGLLQYPEEGHFALFRDAEAARRSFDFLASASDGEAIIGR